MKCLILGHYVLDEIHTLDGGVIESPGGIAFCLGGFNGAARPGDRILPVFPVGDDAWDGFGEFVGGLPAIDPSACRRVATPTTRVALYHDSSTTYHTRLVRAMPPIPAPWFDDELATAGLIYINMMTGDDVTIDMAERIRARTDAFCYLDIHMIAYRVGRDGNRVLAPSSEWRRWLTFADAVQCNEHEILALVPGSASIECSLEEIFGRTNLETLVLTRAERGTTIYTASGAPTHIPATPVDALVDPTGCGDVFGSYFSRHFVHDGDVAAAGAVAARAAAKIAGMPGSIGIEHLPALLGKEHA